MNKKLLSAAVSAALVGGAGLQTASADYIFGPYFDTRSGSATVVSTITKFGSTTGWAYLYKDLAVLDQRCTHADVPGEQSPNDLTTFNIGRVNPDGSLFVIFSGVDDVGGADGIAPGFNGMFVVEDFAGESESTMAGEVIVFEGGTGDIFSYRMLNHPFDMVAGTEGGATEGEGLFDELGYGSTTSLGGVFGDEPIQGTPTVLWHPGVNTSWFVMAPAAQMFNIPTPDLRLEIALAGTPVTAGAAGDYYTPVSSMTAGSAVALPRPPSCSTALPSCGWRI